MKLNNSSSTITFATLTLTFFLLLTGCSEEEKGTENRSEYLKVKNEFMELYTILHPLKSSRLGITAADSALFLFTDQELTDAITGIERTLSDLSGLTTAGLSEEEVDNSRLIINRLRGEKFALNSIRYYTQPVIYCWAVREALWGIPSRKGIPGKDELADYRKRLGRVPALLENARKLIEKPSTMHIEISLDILNELSSDMDPLEELIQSRYGNGISEVEMVFREIKRFRRFVKDTLSKKAKGRIILGTENLTGIFKYEENIYRNSDFLINTAGQKMKVLRKNLEGLADKSNRISRDDSPDPERTFSPEDLRELAARIRKTRRDFKVKEKIIQEITVQRGPKYPRDNPFFSIPYGEHSLIEWIPPHLGNPISSKLAVTPLIMEEENGKVKIPESLVSFELIKAFTLNECCSSSSDTLRALLGSTTYRYAMLLRGVDEILKEYEQGSFHLRRRYIKWRLVNLARMIAVFRLHEGKFTVRGAIDFFVEKAGITEEEAEGYVREAYVSPSSAYAGISEIILADIVSKLAKTDDRELQRMNTDDLLEQNRLLPLQQIEEKYF